jgi:hypothetical protein
MSLLPTARMYLSLFIPPDIRMSRSSNPVPNAPYTIGYSPSATQAVAFHCPFSIRTLSSLDITEHSPRDNIQHVRSEIHQRLILIGRLFSIVNAGRHRMLS